MYVLHAAMRENDLFNDIHNKMMRHALAWLGVHALPAKSNEEKPTTNERGKSYRLWYARAGSPTHRSRAPSLAHGFPTALRDQVRVEMRINYLKRYYPVQIKLIYIT